MSTRQRLSEHSVQTQAQPFKGKIISSYKSHERPLVKSPCKRTKSLPKGWTTIIITTMPNWFVALSHTMETAQTGYRTRQIHDEQAHWTTDSSTEGLVLHVIIRGNGWGLCTGCHLWSFHNCHSCSARLRISDGREDRGTEKSYPASVPGNMGTGKDDQKTWLIQMTINVHSSNHTTECRR